MGEFEKGKPRHAAAANVISLAEAMELLAFTHPLARSDYL
jgi:hypothetical protein